MNFLFKTPRQLLNDSFQLGRKLYMSGFRPNHAISLWRGGTIVGLGINEYYRMQGVFINHTAITTSTYNDDFTQKEVIIRGLEHVIKVVVPEDELLIIDDIFDTGETIRQLLRLLETKTRKNMPHRIKIATVDRKPENNVFTTDLTYLNDIAKDVWVNYPHELSDLIMDNGENVLKQRNEKAYNLLCGKDYPIEEIKVDSPYYWAEPDDILENSIKLGVNIFNSDFEPDFLIALWPGGVLSGIYIHETYKYLNRMNGKKKKNPTHVAINTTSSHLSYKNNIIGLPYLFDHIEYDSRILIIDTTYQAGIYVNPVIDKLKDELRRNMNHKNIRIATLYYNPNAQYTWTTKPYFSKPHYYSTLINTNVIYPHSIHKLLNPKKEVKECCSDLYDIIWGDF